MPIIYVDEQILNYKVECVVCPVKGNQLYMHQEIAGLIYNKAGTHELDYEFLRTSRSGIGIPMITSGVNLSKVMIHIIGADMLLSRNFRKDMYNAYDRVLRVIRDKKFRSVVFPPIPFSYKRLGDMHSYRTGMTLMKYFNKLYDLNDISIYLLVNKRTLQDHLNNYVSTYTPTSAISRRHKPTVYPLKNDDELNDFLKECSYTVFEQYYGVKDYNLEIKNTKLSKLCEYIKKMYPNNDIAFCIDSNMNKINYIKLFETEYIPTKLELFGICLALKLDIDKSLKLLEYCDKQIDYDDEGDCKVISAIATRKYDVLTLNQNLFLNDLAQVGSNIHPSKFVTSN